MTKHFRLSLFACILLLTGSLTFADLEVFDGSPKYPHQKVAELEVSVSTSRAFSFVWTPAHIKKKLQDELKKAACHYDADAIAEVQYYPTPAQPSFFRKKEYYARGSLVKYTKFPEPSKQGTSR